ncbi:hypothetical protein Dimus_039787 [Dionaea muscipula]
MSQSKFNFKQANRTANPHHLRSHESVTPLPLLSSPLLSLSQFNLSLLTLSSLPSFPVRSKDVEELTGGLGSSSTTAPYEQRSRSLQQWTSGLVVSIVLL